MGEVAFYRDRFVGIDEKVIPIQERGHQFGDGIYEVVRVYGGEPFLLNEHLDRLEKSADALQLIIPYSKEDISGIIFEALERSAFKNAEIYFQVTRGIGGRQHHYPEVPAVFSLTVRPAKNILESIRRKGIKVMLSDDIRWSYCYIKSLNLLPNVMAKQKAVSEGFYESIFVKDGIITEGASSNLFVVKDGELFTHPATKAILHGITRDKVIELAEKQGLTVRQEEFNEDFFRNSDEAFITSTGVEVLPIAQIDGIALPVDRPITYGLMEMFKGLYAVKR